MASRDVPETQAGDANCSERWSSTKYQLSSEDLARLGSGMTDAAEPGTVAASRTTSPSTTPPPPPIEVPPIEAPPKLRLLVVTPTDSKKSPSSLSAVQSASESSEPLSTRSRGRFASFRRRSPRSRSRRLTNRAQDVSVAGRVLAHETGVRRHLIHQLKARGSDPLQGLSPRSSEHVPGSSTWLSESAPSHSIASTPRSSRSSGFTGRHVWMPPLLGLGSESDAESTSPLTSGHRVIVSVRKGTLESLQRENKELRDKTEALKREIEYLRTQCVRVDNGVIAVWQSQRFVSSNGWSSSNLLTSSDPHAWEPAVPARAKAGRDAASASLGLVRHAYAKKGGAYGCLDLQKAAGLVLPDHMRPATELGFTSWCIVASDETDAEGWSYAVSFTGRAWHDATSLQRVCRRRLWVRRRLENPTAARSLNSSEWKTGRADAGSRLQISIHDASIAKATRPRIGAKPNLFVLAVLVNGTTEHNLMEKSTNILWNSSFAPRFTADQGTITFSLDILAQPPQMIPVAPRPERQRVPTRRARSRLPPLNLYLHLFHKPERGPAIRLGSAKIKMVTVEQERRAATPRPGAFGLASARASEPHGVKRAARARRGHREAKSSVPKSFQFRFHRKRQSVIPVMSLESQMTLREGVRVTRHAMELSLPHGHASPRSVGSLFGIKAAELTIADKKKNSTLKPSSLTVSLSFETAEFQALQQFGKPIDHPEVRRKKLKKYDAPIPIALIRLGDTLVTEGGLATVGIFRIGPSTQALAITERLVVLGRPLKSDGDSGYDFVAIAHLIKSFFLRLPAPLVRENELLSMRDGAFGEAAATIPEPRQSLLLWLLDLAVKALREKKSNRMNCRALGVCMGTVVVSHVKDKSLGSRLRTACAFFAEGVRWRAGLPAPGAAAPSSVE